jgi:hypothetical protein
MQRRTRALVPALVGPAAFGLAALIGARRVPGYRHRDEPMSALAAKGTASSPVMISGFLALGAATWALAGALDRDRVPRSIVLMLRTAGIGTVAAGLARQSDRSCPVRFMGDDNVTLSDDLHVLTSMAVFGPWIAMPFVAAARGNALPGPARRRAFVLGCAALAGQVWTSVLIQRNAEQWGGVAQRVTVASALAFYPVIATAAT